jgi:hypothetical protein
VTARASAGVRLQLGSVHPIVRRVLECAALFDVFEYAHRAEEPAANTGS